MVDLAQIREFADQSLKKDMEQQCLTISGKSIAEALKQASIELSLPLKNIDYEILDKGSAGIFGIKRTPCYLLVYPSSTDKSEIITSEEIIEKASETKLSCVDGIVCIRKEPQGIMMKISSPKKGGKRITEQDAIQAIHQRNIMNADMEIINKIVKKADNIFVKIADFQHDPSQDANIDIDITNEEMNAYIIIEPAGEYGIDLNYDFIIGSLHANNIVYGILDDFIHKIIDTPIYNERLLVAEGKPVKHGEDGNIEYYFELDTKNIRLKEIDGKIDYREVSQVNNVVSGQVLAKLIQPTYGEDGKTVTGKVLLAKEGSGKKLLIGNNVRISDDGVSAIAEKNGQVVLANNKITVEPVFVVDGGVNLKTGNILFLGTVIVLGNIDDGFSVKASSNIEITGSVGKCDLEAEGDIIIRHGMNGRETGTITAGGNIYAKFIENSTVISNNMVIVSDGIVNCKVSSDKKVLCKGKRASIVGGYIRAAEEINAKTLGSIANVETILEVGFDPKSKKRLDELAREQRTLEEKFNPVKKNLLIFERMIKTKKEISEDRLKRYKKLKSYEKELNKQLSEIANEQEKIIKYLADIKMGGKISASQVIFPGVRLFIKDASLEIRHEFKQSTFVNDNDMVKVIKYEEISEDINMIKLTRRL